MSERVVQLRRYRIVPGEMAAFVDWWRTVLLPARQAFGFVLEFAVVVRETDEFVWAVSASDAGTVLSGLEAAWQASPERAAAFAGVPQRVASMDLRDAEPVG